MKVKLGELKEMTKNLSNLMEKNFPVRAHYAISRNLSKLLSEFREYDNNREELCKKFARKDKDNNPVLIDGKYDIPDDSMKEFSDSICELRDTEIEVDILAISVSEFEKCNENPRFDLPTGPDFLNMIFMLKD